VRAHGIALAVQNVGYKAELITYSDDMDGLRKVPANLPEWLNAYLAKPVSVIPDPYGGCHTSYGSHMSGLLLDGLDKLGVKYVFQSAAEAYKKGILSKQIDILLKNSTRLGEKITELVGQEKYTETLPYFPVCKNCGRLYVAKALKYLADEQRVLYLCSGSIVNKKYLEGCGYSGTADIHKGEGKLAWKVEFAARWQALDIRFEAYGKDILDSVRINDWVANEILGFVHPLHIKYEMFLDKAGKKISKSEGNVFTPQMWLEYGSAESLLLLLFKRIKGTRHIGLEDIPLLMDEYDLYEDIYFGRVKEDNPSKSAKVKGIYEYINHFRPPMDSSIHIPYRMLVQQASLFPEDSGRINKVFERLLKYGMAKQKTPDLIKRIELASRWFQDLLLLDEESVKIELKENHKKAMAEFIQTLRSLIGAEKDPDTSRNIQSRLYDISRSNKIEPKEFFNLLYRMLINSDRGPRIGNYAVDLGIERTCEILQRYITN